MVIFKEAVCVQRKDNSVGKTRNQEVGFLISVLGNLLLLVGCLTGSLSLKFCVKVYLTAKNQLLLHFLRLFPAGGDYEKRNISLNG